MNIAALATLSRRELQVFEAIASGISPKRMAVALVLSPKTVSTYRARIFEKLEIASNAECATLRAQAQIQRAADHTLIAAGFIAGVVMWAFDRQELVVNDQTFATPLADGIPVLDDKSRAAIKAAIEAARARDSLAAAA